MISRAFFSTADHPFTGFSWRQYIIFFTVVEKDNAAGYASYRERL
ncbi:hypothetical protein BAXH7_03508 [Bacillus amyloliquefaciens XH7]|nr:hypothetical protein BAXH7_03508 [Bacillus amyloliquefaciens XH7]